MKNDREISHRMIAAVKQLGLESQLFHCNYGLEKENVRTNSKGELAVTKHPKAFGDKLKNPYIVTDFSESQIEMITPICEDLNSCLTFLENLHDSVSLELKDEYLWPGSMPPILPMEEEIPIAEYSDTKEGMKARAYRERLAAKYGSKKQLISGIHYNFSFKESFLQILYNEVKDLGVWKDFKNFKNCIYLKISRDYLKYGWILVYLLGSSVAIDKSYSQCKMERLENITGDIYCLPYATSIRNSRCGYKNPESFIVSFDHVEDYVAKIRQLINSGDIQSAAEYYSPIRLKGKDNGNVLDSLEENGIEYLEIRSIDLNPTVKNGIDLKSLHFIHLFVLYTLFNKREEFDEKVHKMALMNWELAASIGRKSDAKLYIDDATSEEIKKLALEVLEGMKNIAHEIGFRYDEHIEIIKEFEACVRGEQPLISQTVYNGIVDEGYIQYHLHKATEYKAISKKNEFLFLGFEDLELSTQIFMKDAIKRGVKVEIIDRKENFLCLTQGDKKEYVKQATKTSLDAYSTFLIMENKLVTKKILEDAHIRVPEGDHFTSEEAAKNSYNRFAHTGIVIKPKSTNFGIGITIFKYACSREDYDKAIAFAFEHDDAILIETFIPGKEYRFFVIGNQVVGILHRVPANVIGDGDKTIRELVEKKNEDPLRGEGYVKPLEKIKLGDTELMFLKEQGLTFDSIIPSNEIVYLRENSNISTGGDSIDFTDDIDEAYKKEAVRAAQAVGAVICGVDMMIKDIHAPFSKEAYGIIELNFNPAIHIHCYPYKGKNRKLGDHVLDALGFEI